jgi:hypothetical protein
MSAVTRQIPDLAALAISASIFPFAIQSAAADIITADFNGNTSFDYQITHMPDLDQRRMAGPGILGLPGNGAMYCVPTSTMNMMMYMANHGFPAVLPGPGAWQNQNLYNAATLNLAVMGIHMSTDAEDGTGGDGWLNGANSWLAQNAEGAKFTVQLKYFTGALGPNLNSLTQSACQGNLVSFAYGFYESLGTHEGLPYYKRVGGHIVTMSKSHRNGSDQTLWCRDPASDSANTTQSLFANREFDVEGKAIYTQDDNGDPVFRLMSALDFSDTGNQKFIDGALLIRPKAGYSFENTGNAWVIHQNFPLVIAGFNTPPAQTILPTEGFVHDGIMANDGVNFYSLNAVVGPSGVPRQLRCLDMTTSQSTILNTLSNAFRLAMGHDNDLYILTPTELHCYDLTQEPPVLQTVALPFPGSAMSFDPVKKEVAVLSVANRRVMRYGNLALPPINMTIPTQIPLTGIGQLAVHPLTGMYWFLTQATPTLHGWGLDDAGAPLFDQINVPNITPTSLDFDDTGHLFAGDGSVLKEMQKTATAGWQLVRNSAFEGADIGPIFHITKSESNFDVNQHNGPGYINVHPDLLPPGKSVLDCDADLDRNELVNVNDLLMVINGWGSCSMAPCFSDVDGNRAVDVDDLLGVIGGWGACP